MASGNLLLVIEYQGFETTFFFLFANWSRIKLTTIIAEESFILILVDFSGWVIKGWNQSKNMVHRSVILDWELLAQMLL